MECDKVIIDINSKKGAKNARIKSLLAEKEKELKMLKKKQIELNALQIKKLNEIEEVELKMKLQYIKTYNDYNRPVSEFHEVEHLKRIFTGFFFQTTDFSEYNIPSKLANIYNFEDI